MESWRERKVEQLQCNYFVWQITLMTNSLKDKILVNVFSACMKSCNSLGRALFAWTACVVNSMHCNFPLISTLHTFSRPANFSKWTQLLSHPLVLPTLCTILGWRPCKRHTVLFLLKGSQDCDFTCFFCFFASTHSFLWSLHFVLRPVSGTSTGADDLFMCHATPPMRYARPQDYYPHWDGKVSEDLCPDITVTDDCFFVSFFKWLSTSLSLRTKLLPTSLSLKTGL